MKANSKAIQVIGIDASGLEGLSETKKTLILYSKRIAAPSRILPDLKHWLEKQKGQSIKHEFFNTDQIHNLIAWLKKNPKQTTVLASGDPLWFGIGRQIAENFPPSSVSFHPSPTSFQIAFSKIGVPWQNCSWVSLHGRDPNQLAQSLQKRPKSLVILTEPKQAGAEEVRVFLRASGLEESYAFWIFENLGHEKERFYKIKPNEPIPKDIDPLYIIILLHEPPRKSIPEELPLFGVDDGIFAQYEDCPGLMTKKEVRIQILSDLELPEEGVLWDVGAGVGSIGLEALRIRPRLKLLSIEKRIGSKLLIQQNAEILGVKPHAIYENEALALIQNEGKIQKELMSPNRVLIGGGGTKNNDILNAIIKHISIPGIIVIPMVTLQSIPCLINTLKSKTDKVYITQHQSYRGVALKKDIRLNPMNPVFILKAKL